MPRIRTATEGADAEVAAELAVAEQAVRRALGIVAKRHRAAVGNYDLRRNISRVHRDLDRCIEALRAVRAGGMVGDAAEAPPTPRRTPVPLEVAE